MGNIKPSNIPNRLRNVSAEHPYVAGAVDIYDDAKGENQQSINASNDTKFSQMDDEIEALVKQDVVPVDTLPSVSDADPKKIYRVVGETSYTDYMVNASGDGWKELATYSFPGIDDEPTAGSPNLVKSGGVFLSQKPTVILSKIGAAQQTVNTDYYFYEGVTYLLKNDGTANVNAYPIGYHTEPYAAIRADGFYVEYTPLHSGYMCLYFTGSGTADITVLFKDSVSEEIKEINSDYYHIKQTSLGSTTYSFGECLLIENATYKVYALDGLTSDINVYKSDSTSYWVKPGKVGTTFNSSSNYGYLKIYALDSGYIDIIIAKVGTLANDFIESQLEQRADLQNVIYRIENGSLNTDNNDILVADGSDLTAGYYRYSDGQLETPYQYHTPLISVKEGEIVKVHCVPSSAGLVALIAAYSNNSYIQSASVQDNYSLGQNDFIDYNYTVPAGITHIAISCRANANNSQYATVTKTVSAFVLKDKSVKTKHLSDEVKELIKIGGVVVNHLYAYREDGTDTQDTFYGINAIKKALDSIVDNSPSNRYIIHIEGHFIFDDVTNHTKAMNAENNSNTWWVNVYGKDYVTLDGGNSEITSIEMYLGLDTVFPSWSNDDRYKYYGGNYHVIFNNALWFECRNITFVGRNTRYCLHQENFNETIPSYVLFENCVFEYGYDGIWTRDNVEIPPESMLLPGNTVVGCGYRMGGDINYKDCKLICTSKTANTGMNGSHSGYHNNNIDVYKPAIIKYDSCQFIGLTYSFLTYETYYDVADEFIFNNCAVPDFGLIRLSVRPQQNSVAKSLAKVHIAHSPMPYVKNNDVQGSVVLRAKVSSGNSSIIRVKKGCSAYGIFGIDSGDSECKMTEWGAYETNGFIYKDDDYGLNGYLLGTQAISVNTLGNILGDCSISNKTLTLVVNNVEVSVVINQDMSNMSNSDVVDILNNGFNNVVFDIVDLSDYYYPSFDNIVMLLNSGVQNIEKGMGIVVVNTNEYRIATSSDEVIDGIAIDDTPMGQLGRVALEGCFSGNMLQQITGLSDNKYYAIGNVAGKFIEVPRTSAVLKSVSSTVIKLLK